MKTVGPEGGWWCGTDGHLPQPRGSANDTKSAARQAASAAAQAAQGDTDHITAEQTAATDEQGRMLLSRDLVTSDFMDEVNDKIGAINRRARRPVIETKIEPNPDYDPSAYDPKKANIEVLSPHVASVWALSDSGIGNHINGLRRIGAWDFSGDGEPLAFGDGMDRSQIPDPRVCDHCDTRRKRNMVFVFEDEEGSLKHIGSTCLKDITGSSSSNMLWLSKYFTAGEHDPALSDWLMGRKSSRASRGGGKAKTFDVRTYVAAAVLATKNGNGGEYISTRKFDEREHEAPTKFLAQDEYIDRPLVPPGDNAAEDEHERWGEQVAAWSEALAEADHVIAWARGMDPDNDFEENLRAIADSNEIGRRALGLASYLPEAHKRSQKERSVQRAVEEVPEEEVRSVEVPTGRVEHTGRIISIKEHDQFFGDRHRVTLKATIRCGAYDVWGTLPSTDYDYGKRLAKGDKIAFKGTTEQSDELGFGFFKRPSQATVLERAIEEDAGADS